jgi:hypothetical protein
MTTTTSPQKITLTATELDHLLSPAAIREKANAIYSKCLSGGTHFQYHSEKWDSTVKTVLEVIHENYPTLKIPFHSRWGHFRVGGVPRLEAFEQNISHLDPVERGRVKLDLVIPSVLLDAGAGMGWKYLEASSGGIFSRSEGLGVASFHWFLSGAFSQDGKSLRSDRTGLSKVNLKDLETAFQVTTENPLVGGEGRVKLLNNLGSALGNKKIFRDGRPGNIIDYLSERYGKSIPASGVLRAVLDGLGPIWPGRLTGLTDEGEVNLGDVWSHPGMGSGVGALVPFHKLSQWMTYSLIEPIEEAGFTVTGVEGLTGLAEYRNGGLFLDSGLISPRNLSDLQKEWTPESEWIIEWRALTVALLDRMGEEVQKALGKSPSEFPLAKVLEGGTWWAGRKLAAALRPGATPPVKIKSDGTVF